MGTEAILVSASDDEYAVRDESGPNPADHLYLGSFLLLISLNLSEDRHLRWSWHVAGGGHGV